MGGFKNVLTLNLMDGGKVTVTKTNIARLVEAGQATRFGGNGQRLCGARTRCGSPCRKVVMRGRNRCLNHGGRSFGPVTPEGREAVRQANLIHGRRSKAYVEQGKAIRLELRALTSLMKRTGMIPQVG